MKNKNRKYYGTLWRLSITHEKLYDNISKNRDFLNDFIDKYKFEENIWKIADFILENLSYRSLRCYTVWGKDFIIDISEFKEKEKFLKTFCDYKIFWKYNTFLDVFHWNFFSFKFLAENFNRIKNHKKRLMELLQDTISYYTDCLFKKKWLEILYTEKRKLKKSKKETFAFKFFSQGTNWTIDWYDNIYYTWYIVISALNEEQARKALIKEHWVIKKMTQCHSLDRYQLEKCELNKQFIAQFRNQKNIWLYRPYLIYMN